MRNVLKVAAFAPKGSQKAVLSFPDENSLCLLKTLPVTAPREARSTKMAMTEQLSESQIPSYRAPAGAPDAQPSCGVSSVISPT